MPLAGSSLFLIAALAVGFAWIAPAAAEVTVLEFAPDEVQLIRGAVDAPSASPDTLDAYQKGQSIPPELQREWPVDLVKKMPKLADTKYVLQRGYVYVVFANFVTAVLPPLLTPAPTP